MKKKPIVTTIKKKSKWCKSENYISEVSRTKVPKQKYDSLRLWVMTNKSSKIIKSKKKWSVVIDADWYLTTLLKMNFTSNWQFFFKTFCNIFFLQNTSDLVSFINE